MTAGNGYWSTPVSDYDAVKFRKQMTKRYGAGVVFENKPVKFAFLISATDVGGVGQPKTFDVVTLASNAATAAGNVDNTAANTGMPGSPTTRSQQPKIGPDGIIPQGTSILVAGIGSMVLMPLVIARAADADPTSPAGSWEAIAAADDQLSGIQAAFDCGLIQLYDNVTQKGEALGHECTTYGASRVAVFGPPTITTTEDGVSTVDSMVYAGQYTGKDRGWSKIQPAFFDGGGNGRPQSQMKINWIVPREAAWPIRTGARFRAEVWLPAIWAYIGGAGVVACEPGDQNNGAVDGPGYTGGAGMRIEPDTRW